MNKQNLYRTNNSKVLQISWPVWMFVTLQVGMNLYLAPTLMNNGHHLDMIFINLVLGAISIPSLYIFFNCLKHSTTKEFVITYDSLILTDTITKERIEIQSKEIYKIELNMIVSGSPWSTWRDYHYYVFTDKSQNQILVTSYILKIEDFWRDSLVRRVKSDNLVIHKKMLPIIKSIV